MSPQELSASSDAHPKTEPPTIEVGMYPDHFYHEAQATFVVSKAPPRWSVRRALFSPPGVLFLSSLLMVALVSFGLGASATASNTTSTRNAAATTQTSSSAMTTAAQAQTFDLTFYAWAAPGSVYPFHCHILSHLMNPGQSSDKMGGLVALVEYAK